MAGSTVGGQAHGRGEDRTVSENRAPAGGGRRAAEDGRRIRTMKGLCHKCYRSNVETTLDGFPREDAYGGKPICMDCVAHIHGMRSTAAPGSAVHG